MATDISRRAFLLSGVGGLITSTLASCSNSIDRQPLLLSGYQRYNRLNTTSGTEANYGIAGISRDGYLVFDLATPQRVHDSLFLPHNGQALFFARRPGTQVYVVDIPQGKITHTIQAARQRHFYGHGVTCRKGRFLYLTENAYDQQRGCIGVYDIQNNFQRVDEFSSAGIGPHQLKLLHDDRTLVVANGGILTHPARGRKKLNLDSMQPSLAYIDRHSGELIDDYRLPHPQQSIRHLDIDAQNRIVIGIQFQGSPSQQLPLAYTHTGETQLQPLHAEEQIWQRHQQYIGSVCIDESGHYCLLSSPRGGIVSSWDLRQRRFVSMTTQRDGAGLAFDKALQRFVVSNGVGQISHLSRQGALDSASHTHFFKQRSWDNHMSTIALLDSNALYTG